MHSKLVIGIFNKFKLYMILFIRWLQTLIATYNMTPLISITLSQNRSLICMCQISVARGCANIQCLSFCFIWNNSSSLRTGWVEHCKVKKFKCSIWGRKGQLLENNAFHISKGLDSKEQKCDIAATRTWTWLCKLQSIRLVYVTMWIL